MVLSGSFRHPRSQGMHEPITQTATLVVLNVALVACILVLTSLLFVVGGFNSGALPHVAISLLLALAVLGGVNWQVAPPLNFHHRLCPPLSLWASLTGNFRLCCRLIIQTGTVEPAAQREELGLDKPVVAVFPEEDQAIPDSGEKEKEH